MNIVKTIKCRDRSKKKKGEVNGNHRKAKMKEENKIKTQHPSVIRFDSYEFWKKNVQNQEHKSREIKTKLDEMIWKDELRDGFQV